MSAGLGTAEVSGQSQRPQVLMDCASRQIEFAADIGGTHTRSQKPSDFLTPNPIIGMPFVDVAQPQMLRMRRIQNKVVKAVVRPIAVGVVDDFGSSQAPTERSLHNQPMLEDRAFRVAIPDVATNIALVGDIDTEESILSLTATATARQPVERVQATRVGAVALIPTSIADGALLKADEAGDLNAATAGAELLGATAFRAASGISRGDLGRDPELITADHTEDRLQRTAITRQRRRKPCLHTPKVYRIAAPSYHSEQSLP